MSRISEIALAFLGRGGKRLRPRLCRRVFEICGGTGAIDPVCDAVECFHKASLIHDDIQDGDEERYGRPTTWKEHGVGVAIAAGDWLVAHGYRLIVKSGFPSAASMLEAVVESHMRLCEGQGDDLLAPGANPLASGRAFDRAGYLSTCARKTGEAFALAAQLGARAAGADDAPYRRFGLAYGILFQIDDDLADGASSPELLRLRAAYGRRLADDPVACRVGLSRCG